MAKRDKVIFLSGKYAGDIDKNVEYARNFAEELWDAGYTVICPHLNTANFDELGLTSHKDYLNGYIEIMSRCDAVFALPNWKDSSGAQSEITGALSRGIPVFESLDLVNLWYEYDKD